MVRDASRRDEPIQVLRVIPNYRLTGRILQAAGQGLSPNTKQNSLRQVEMAMVQANLGDYAEIPDLSVWRRSTLRPAPTALAADLN